MTALNICLLDEKIHEKEGRADYSHMRGRQIIYTGNYSGH